MAAFYGFTEKISCVQSLSWSDDDRIAFCTDTSIKCLTLTSDVSNLESTIQCEQSFIPAIAEILDVPMFTEDDHKAFLRNLPRDDVQFLVVDRTLNPFKHMQDTLPRTGFCLLAWSPPGGDKTGRCIITTVSHDHRMCLYSQLDSKFEWHKIADLSMIGHAQARPKLTKYDVTEFYMYRTWCHRQVPTGISWCDSLVIESDGDTRYGLLAVGTRSGDIFIWKVNMPCANESDCSILHTVSCDNTSPVNCLKWKSNTGTLAAGYVNGPVHLVNVDLHTTENEPRTVSLCGDTDLLRVADMYFIQHDTKSALLVNKEQYVLVFILEDIDKQPIPRLKTIIPLFGDNILPSSGMFRLNRESVVMVSQDCLLQKITIDWQSPDPGCCIESLECDITTEDCDVCLGLDVSPNSLLIAYVLRPKPGYDHLAVQGKRNYTSIVIRCPDELNIGSNCSETAQKLLLDTDRKLGSMMDVLTIFRHTLNINKPPDFTAIQTSPNQNFRISQLKRLGILIDWYALKSKMKARRWPTDTDGEKMEHLEKAVNDSSHTVLLMYILTCLQLCLSTDHSCLSQSPHRDVVICMWRFVDKYADEYPDLVQDLSAIKSKLLEKMKIKLDEQEIKCCICSTNLNIDKLNWKCNNDHTFDMCCKTCRPCQGVDYTTCTVCKSHSTITTNTLKDISWLPHPSRCTYCETLMMYS